MTSTADLIAAARSHSIGDIPRRTAARMPHKTAIVNGDVRLTFAEFDAVIDRTAAALAALGMIKGDRLAILSHNCWQFPVTAFAAARLGVILVPIREDWARATLAAVVRKDEARPAVVQTFLRLLKEAAHPPRR